MPKSHKPYPLEFRRQMVELVRAGRTPDELGKEFEPSSESIRNWSRLTRPPAVNCSTTSRGGTTLTAVTRPSTTNLP